MAWAILVLSGVLEAVWATALSASNGFKKVVPTIVFVAGMALSMVGLAFAMKSIPVGTAYAVWVGVGASLTVVVAILRRRKPRPSPDSPWSSVSWRASSASRW